MIRITSLIKRYGTFKAVDNVTIDIEDGTVYGLVGINGAGKSTLLRTIAGIYKPNAGSVRYDGKNVYDNPAVKREIAFVPDELYLPNGYTVNSMAKKFREIYKGKFNMAKYAELARAFQLDVNRKFNSFSKGMKRQAATILALALETKYIFFDETFDGLDPFKRAYVKKIIIDDVRSRGATAIISSHSLRELSDVCDKLAIINKGRLIHESDLSHYGNDVTKLQIAFARDADAKCLEKLEIIDSTKVGSVYTLIVKGEHKKIMSSLKAYSPVLIEELPLTFEEIFTIELAKHGVDAFTFFGQEVLNNE